MKRRQIRYGGCCSIMRFLTSILLTEVASAATIMSTQEQPLRYTLDLGHRRLGAADPDARHDSPPARKRVKEEKETSRFSYYMVSDCKPRSSGYFGSTGGDPVLFQYGFELETTIFATMDKILNIINGRVMDEMISRTFSDMCGVHRRRDQESVSTGSMAAGRVTGFHFSSEEVVPSMTCTPQLNQKNSCSYYAGQVKVFGYDFDDTLVQQLMGYARDALPLGLADAAQSGAVRIVLSDDLTKQLEGPGPSSATRNGGADSTGVGATAGLVLACSVLFVSIGVLGAYYFTEIRNKTGKSKGKKGRARSAIARYFDTGSLTNTYQVTESDDSEARAAARSSSRASPSKGKRGSNGGSDRSDDLDEDTTDWRPIVVEFGPSFDPDRDRYLQAMEELSSVPPSYAKQLAMSAEMSFMDLQIV